MTEPDDTVTMPKVRDISGDPLAIPPNRIQEEPPVPPPVEMLTHEARERLAALALVAPLMRSRKPFGGEIVADVTDQIRLATWVLYGVDSLDLMPRGEDE